MLNRAIRLRGRGLRGGGLLIGLVMLGLSCGGSGDGEGNTGSSGSDMTLGIAEVRITPSTAMLTELGETLQMSAQAFDAEGNEIEVEFSWRSSHPDELAVDDNGLVTAMTVGSGEIWAETEGTRRSNSAVLMSATPVPGAHTVNDDQLVGLIEVVDPAAPFGMGFQFRMTLRGMDPPAVGEIVVGTGEAPIGGRVVAVETVGADVMVTLEMIPLPEMFDEIAFDEQISMANATTVINEEASEFYDMEEDASGRLVFTLKEEFQGTSVTSEGPTNAAVSALQASTTTCESGEFKILSFCCKVEAGAPLTLNLAPTVAFTTPSLGLIRRLNPDGSFQTIELRGEGKVEFKQSVVMNAQVEGKASCSAVLAEKKFPAPSYLGLLLGASAPLGIGFEVGGKVPIAEFGFELIANAGANVALGYRCPTSDCEVVNEFKPKGDMHFVPKSRLATSTIRMETTLAGFLFVALKLGVSGSYVGQFLAVVDIAIEDLEVVSYKAGPTFKGMHAGVKDQVLDSSYKSSHVVSLDFVLEFLQQLMFFENRFAINLPFVPKVTTTFPLATGPAAVSAKADVASFEQRDVVRFEVKLKPDTVNFAPFVYNVEAVHIYRKPAGLTQATPAGELELVASDTPTSDGQLKFGSVAEGELDFSLSWTATEAGTVEGNFFAFVDTGAFCSGECDNDIEKFLGSLELQEVDKGADCGYGVVNGE